MNAGNTNGITLDTGALIAAEANDARFWAAWRQAIRKGTPITLPAVVLAQAWRGNRQARMARAINKCVVSIIDADDAKVVGELLAAAKTVDIVDAAVVVDALGRDDEVWTSDPRDLHVLAATAGRKLRLAAL